MLTLTVDVPGPNGSNATPPAATDVGLLDCPGWICTVTLPPEALDVLTTPTLWSLQLIVTVSGHARSGTYIE